MYIRAEQKLWNFKLVQLKLGRILSEKKKIAIFFYYGLVRTHKIEILNL